MYTQISPISIETGEIFCPQGNISLGCYPVRWNVVEGFGGAARPAQRVRQCESGGAAALGSPDGGAGERSASLRGRGQWQIWENAEIVAVYPLSHGCAVPALPKGEPRGGRSPPSAEGKTVRTRRRSRPWLPLWGSWRAISEPERAWAVASLGKCGDCSRVPSQSRLRRASSPKGRAK